MNLEKLMRDMIRTGEGNAVPSAALESLTGLNSREVRQHIEAMRRSGAVICSSASGYYYPESRAELLRYIAKERRRAGSIQRTLVSAETMLNEWRD